jgi:PD-(D/E)XK nuclease superfamily
MTRRSSEVPDQGVYRTPKHLYYWNGAGPWPGVTTVTDVLDKPALTHWLREQVATAALEHADRLVADRAAGNSEAAVAFLLATRNAGTDGRNRGSRLHAAIEGILRHENPLIDAADLPAAEGARAWLNEQAVNNRLRPLEVESYVLNTTLGYGGTVDLIAEMDGDVWLLDWKTGKSVAGRDGRVYNEMRLQLAAYANAEFIGRSTDPTRYEMPAITRCGIVHVTDAGTRLYDANVSDEDWIAFRACLRLHQWRAAA